MKYNCFVFIATVFIAFSASGQKEKQPLDYVDNFIGVRDLNSSCVLGPQLPQGSISPSPQTAPGSIKYDMDCYVMGQPIRGFGQLHVSGTGWGKYGMFLLSPQIGLATGETEHDSPKENETATPYQYAVTLSKYGIKTAVTPATHSAIYQFTFPASDSAHLLLDISHNITDIATSMKNKTPAFIDGKVSFSNKENTELKGYGNYIGGFSNGAYKVYFCMRLSKSPAKAGTWLNDRVADGKAKSQSAGSGERLGAYVQYSTKENEVLYVKIGVSLKSIEQATAWLDEEITGWDYDQVKQTAVNSWTKELSKIKVDGGTETEKQIFYTACYHASIMPRDRTNDFVGYESKVPMWDDHLAVWDTWRTLYPLKVLTNPAMVSGTINSFIARYKKYNRVKDAFVAGNEKFQDQGGNNTDNIIADAFVKNVKGVDWKEAYKVMKGQADQERLGINFDKPDSAKLYKELGWLPAGKMSCSVSLEYAYNDFCAAQMAKTLGTSEDYKKYKERSEKWITQWNPDAESDGFKGFINPKELNGNFIAIDNKKNWGSWKNFFYEGNSWTYSYFVPHQFEKLVQLSESKAGFAKKLQHGFEKNLIDYGNEPAFLAVHAFHYADRSDLASYYVRKLMKERFTTQGYSENEDSGAMGSWYIFSAMGFFPNAGQDIYYLTGSSFPAVTLTLGNGKKLNIKAKNASETNVYVQSCKINGKEWSKPWFNHHQIENGGTIEFVMGDKPVQ